MKALATLALVCACASAPRPLAPPLPSASGLLLVPAHDSVRGFSWYAPLLDALTAIADTAQLEHFRCLLGAPMDSVIYIVAAYEPAIEQASPDSVRYDHCPALITAGTWHNHPPPYRFAREDYCALSEQDQQAPEFLQVINVTQGLSCAFVRQPGFGWVRMLNWPPSGP